MQTVELKLKQASAVLGVAPKDLQNLVQLNVLRPRRRNSYYWFDTSLLVQAKLAFYLKDSLGTSTELLARFTEAMSRTLRDQEPTKLGTSGYVPGRRAVRRPSKFGFPWPISLKKSSRDCRELRSIRISRVAASGRAGSASSFGL